VIEHDGYKKDRGQTFRGSAISGPIVQFENNVYAIDNLPFFMEISVTCRAVMPYPPFGVNLLAFEGYTFWLLLRRGGRCRQRLKSLAFPQAIISTSA